MADYYMKCYLHAAKVNKEAEKNRILKKQMEKNILRDKHALKPKKCMVIKEPTAVEKLYAKHYLPLVDHQGQAYLERVAREAHGRMRNYYMNHGCTYN